MERVYTEDSIRFMDQGREKAAFQEKVENGVVLFALSGAISGEITNTLMDEMTALIVAGQGLVVDLDRATYLSASAMEVFLRVEKRLEDQGKYLRIVQMPQEIYDTFKSRGMHELLEIEVKKA
ncbi:MAG: STAS domain-containing protein [Clostridia bacterium]|nr:STAS domain-containing protein [Clostridia bacterium]